MVWFIIVVCFLSMGFCVYKVGKNNKEYAIEDYPKMKPIIEKYSMDLHRVVRYSDTEGVRAPILILKSLKHLGFIKVINSEIHIINPLPQELTKVSFK